MEGLIEAGVNGAVLFIMFYLVVKVISVISSFFGGEK